MQGTVLIIEDEQEIADLISLYLKKEGIETIHASTGEEGMDCLQNSQFDLVLLDINLPGIDGFEVLQKIRQKGKSIPVMIVSARQEDVDMIMGFGIGADDYVSKPFSPKVLSARVRAHLRRIQVGKNDEPQQFRFGPYTLDRDNLWLKKGGERIDLPPKELSLLLILSEHPERAIRQEDLYKLVWENTFGDLTTVSVHIQRLRKKLEPNPAKPIYIKTAYGSGYYITAGEEKE
ncbi:MAG: response regulator transcription factor [Spirochaetales bacterium]|nr:response regulator transcription factor [Spirochaetales bacterium]